MKDAYPLFNPACKGVFGGAEIDLYLLASALAQDKSYRVMFLVGDYGRPDREIINGVELVKLKFSDLQRYPSVFYKVVRRLYIFYMLIKTKADIVFTETASDSLAYIVAVQKLLKKGKVVFRLGSDIDADFDFLKEKSPLLYQLYRNSVIYADTVVCQTASQQNKLIPSLRNKSRIIKNCLPDAGTVDEKKEDYILWVARYDYMKRPELFLGLAQMLPDERFIMIMPGRGNAWERVARAAEQQPNVTFLDYVDFRAVQGYFNRTKCYVNTSTFEGFPNAFLQACAGGAPVVSFVVDPDGIIAQYDLGCVCQDSLEKAAGFIHALDDRTVDRLGKNGRDYFQQNHTLGKTVQLYNDLFVSLIS